jgi:hypothetical protein
VLLQSKFSFSLWGKIYFFFHPRVKMSKFAGGKSVLAQYKTSVFQSQECEGSTRAEDFSPTTNPSRDELEGGASLDLPSPPAAGQAAPSDESQQQPLISSRAVDDWDIVSKLHEEQQAKQHHHDGEQQQKLCRPIIRFQEAYTLLRDDEASWRCHLKDVKRISSHVKTSGFAGLLWSCFHFDIVESSADYDDRDFVLALNFVALDHSNETHCRIITSIFRKLTKAKREDADPPTRGPMWADLGFQGSDPGTDLRSTGMFGLLQILYVLEYFPVLAGTMYAVSTSPVREFPFALVAFNFSGVVMDVLKERGLHDHIHRLRKEAQDEAKSRQNRCASEKIPPDASVDVTSGAISGGSPFGAVLWTPPPVLNAVCELFAASLFTFFSEWVKLPARGIADFGPMKNKLRDHIRSQVEDTLKDCSKARDRRLVLDLENPRGNNRKKSSGKEHADGPSEKLEFHEF